MHANSQNYRQDISWDFIRWRFLYLPGRETTNSKQVAKSDGNVNSKEHRIDIVDSTSYTKVTSYVDEDEENIVLMVFNFIGMVIIFIGKLLFGIFLGVTIFMVLYMVFMLFKSLVELFIEIIFH